MDAQMIDVILCGNRRKWGQIFTDNGIQSMVPRLRPKLDDFMGTIAALLALRVLQSPNRVLLFDSMGVTGAPTSPDLKPKETHHESSSGPKRQRLHCRL